MELLNWTGFIKLIASIVRSIVSIIIAVPKLKVLFFPTVKIKVKAVSKFENGGLVTRKFSGEHNEEICLEIINKKNEVRTLNHVIFDKNNKFNWYKKNSQCYLKSSGLDYGDIPAEIIPKSNHKIVLNSEVNSALRLMHHKYFIKINVDGKIYKKKIKFKKGYYESKF